ncbi:hypothetical protein ACIQAL_13025 [Pseudomonas sp. NPDC088368]|jgi:hypothetical protein|uniref:hypothetical protein n=1 Tax=Pseudomonas sp. NPDC088368 TaxID=3364453 RepID=UPI003820280C
MEWLKDFSNNYANAVTAFAAIGAFVLAWRTLAYLKREYLAKYRPYVVPLVTAVPVQMDAGDTKFHVVIQPVNVGPHPCNIKVSEIRLRIGDESFPGSDQHDWVLIGTNGLGFNFDGGFITQVGIQHIREARYSQNRVELTFTLGMRSMENKNESTKKFLYEIEVRGEFPTVVYRPDLIR